MKVPKPKRLPSGNWNIYMRLGGEPISITKATAQECTREAKLVKAEYLAGKRSAVNREVSEKTLAELEADFIKHHKAVWSPSTQRSYESYKKHRFKKYADRRIMDIKWQDMINDELEHASPKTVKNGWGLASAALKHAGVPVPDVKLAQCPVNEIPFLQPDEVLKFCETIRGKPYELAALLMLHGLRLSEVKAVTWKNIDTKHGTISVHGSAVRGPDGIVQKQTNKNKTSERIVPIIIQRLSDLADQEGKGKDPSEAVVKTNPSNLLEDVKRGCREAGVTETTCHGLRHSYACLLYQIPGVTDRQIMKWGGWSNIQTMHKIYIRIASEDEKRATEAAKSFFTPQQNSQQNSQQTEKVQ